MIALFRTFNLVFFMMRVTIVGFGNQARSWAQNLRDSGFPVRVALRPDSPSFEAAVRERLDTVEIGSEEFFQDRAFALLTPDHAHYDFMISNGHRLTEGSVILYAHGYSLLKHQFQKQFPHLQHVLMAPKSIGSELRRQYLQKGMLGAVYSLEFVQGETESLKKWLMKLGTAMGITMGPFPTSFERETRADLYSEQGLLCSLIPYTAREMFTHLVQDGTEPELAYFEVWHELKLIINAMVDKGPEGFFDLISPNALIGSEKGFQRLMTPEFKQNLKGLLTDIKSGAFDREADATNVEALRKTIRERWTNDPLMQTFRALNHQDRP